MARKRASLARSWFATASRAAISAASCSFTRRSCRGEGSSRIRGQSGRSRMAVVTDSAAVAAFMLPASQ